jgi:hypothetical protein
VVVALAVVLGIQEQQVQEHQVKEMMVELVVALNTQQAVAVVLVLLVLLL